MWWCDHLTTGCASAYVCLTIVSRSSFLLKAFWYQCDNDVGAFSHLKVRAHFNIIMSLCTAMNSSMGIPLTSALGEPHYVDYECFRTSDEMMSRVSVDHGLQLKMFFDMKYLMYHSALTTHYLGTDDIGCTQLSHSKDAEVSVQHFNRYPGLFFGILFNDNHGGRSEPCDSSPTGMWFLNVYKIQQAAHQRYYPKGIISQPNII